MSSPSSIISPKLIQESLTYKQYQSLITDLLAQEKTTGDDHSEDMLNYTRMNVRRMSRWDKTTVVSDALQEKIKNITIPQIWLVLTEAWCGDAAQNIPFMVHASNYSPLVDIRFVLRDEHPEVMDAYLTDGGRSIPKLVALQKNSLEELFVWGPRPQVLQQKYLAYKENPGEMSQNDFIEAIHLWYAKDRNAHIDAEFLTLIG